MVCDRLQVRAGVTTGPGRRRTKKVFSFISKDRFHPRQTVCTYVSETSEKSDRPETTITVVTRSRLFRVPEGRKSPILVILVGIRLGFVQFAREKPTFLTTSGWIVPWFLTTIG